jgi:hypothetical protein
MSGLEVFTLVAGIVSAFSGTASFLADRKKRKAEELTKLRTAVIRDSPQIQHEYSQDFARIEPKFAAGDCKSCTIC